MPSVGYRHDECRHPLPIIGSDVGRTFWKAHIVSIKARVSPQLGTSSLESARYTSYYTNNKDQYTHTQFTLSLLSLLPQGVMFSVWLHSKTHKLLHWWQRWDQNNQTALEETRSQPDGKSPRGWGEALTLESLVTALRAVGTANQAPPGDRYRLQPPIFGGDCDVE